MFLKNFTELRKNDVGIAGGKGASLGEMTGSGIPVPPGFVVLAPAFDQFLKETDLTQEIEAQLDGYPEKKKDYPGRSLNALRAAIDDYRAKRASGAITDAMLAKVAASVSCAVAKPEAAPAVSGDGKVTISLH